jgi:hypothetical protein
VVHCRRLLIKSYRISRTILTVKSCFGFQWSRKTLDKNDSWLRIQREAFEVETSTGFLSLLVERSWSLTVRVLSS